MQPLRVRPPVAMACGLGCPVQLAVLASVAGGAGLGAMGFDGAGVKMIMLRRRHSASEHLAPEVQAIGTLFAPSGRPDDDGYTVLCC